MSRTAVLYQISIALFFLASCTVFPLLLSTLKGKRGKINCARSLTKKNKLVFYLSLLLCLGSEKKEGGKSFMTEIASPSRKRFACTFRSRRVLLLTPRRAHNRSKRARFSAMGKWPAAGTLTGPKCAAHLDAVTDFLARARAHVKRARV